MHNLKMIFYIIFNLAATLRQGRQFLQVYQGAGPEIVMDGIHPSLMSFQGASLLVVIEMLSTCPAFGPGNRNQFSSPRPPGVGDGWTPVPGRA